MYVNPWLFVALLAAASCLVAAFALRSFLRTRAGLSNVAVVDGANGTEVSTWEEDDGRLRIEYNGELKTCAPCADSKPLLVQRGRLTLRVRWFTVVGTTTIEHPLGNVAHLPYEFTEMALDELVSRSRGAGEAVGKPVVHQEDVEAFKRRLGDRAPYGEAFAAEILRCVRGGDADLFADRSFARAMLEHKEAFGLLFAAGALMGTMLGIQLMVDPRFYALMAEEQTTWIMSLLMIAVVGFAMWRMGE